jgi:hypothetical protein
MLQENQILIEMQLYTTYVDSFWSMPLLFAALKLHAGKVAHGDEVEVCMLCVVAAGALGHLAVHGAGSDVVSCSLCERYRHIVLGHAEKHERMAVEQGGIESCPYMISGC